MDNTGPVANRQFGNFDVGKFCCFLIDFGQLATPPETDSKMPGNNTRSDSRFGFLSVVDTRQLGYCGGLLILTAGGRPLEFHCTSPISANRAQQILYGRTLREFLVCDQIGTTLVQKARARLDIILVDDRALLALSASVPTPIAFVLPGGSNGDTDRHASDLEIAGQRFELMGQSLSLAEDLLKTFLRTLPVTEPFERIHQAIQEAHTEAHAEAA